MCIHYLGQLPPIKQTKMTFFFSFTKIGEQEGGTGSAWGIDTVAGP
jgi:hypothetical protein